MPDQRVRLAAEHVTTNLTRLFFSITCKLSSPDTEELVERAIQDISAGGMSIPGCVAGGYIALWAVNFAGRVCIGTRE